MWIGGIQLGRWEENGIRYRHRHTRLRHDLARGGGQARQSEPFKGGGGPPGISTGRRIRPPKWVRTLRALAIVVLLLVSAVPCVIFVVLFFQQYQ